MKKAVLRLWMLMALPMLLGLASCKDDNPVDPNPLASQVSGIWWTLVDTEGTFGGKDYTRVGTGFCLNDDGTGYGATFYFNDESGDPIQMRGGKDFAPFTYTTTADGLITLQFDKGYQPDVDYFKDMTLRYQDGRISISSPQFSTELKQASDAMAALIQQWDRAFNGGASADNYNINDEDFTPTTWREQEAIYIYDGTGKDVTDAKGRTGYTLVNMPWYYGDKLTNLPDGFCDDITPENGWEWVLNRCGSRSIVNNNFFAVYNRYTGILRFFFYLPYGFNTGNDHVWQVSMTDNLALHSLWGYGLPIESTIDKAALGQKASDTYMEYVTPWTDYMSQDGLIVPNAGWWAFDVDLSTYRPNANLTEDNIKLQMRSWNTQHASFYSAITANIDGTIKAQLDLDQTPKKSSNTAQGVMLGLKGAAQVASAIGGFVTGDWASGLTSVGYLLGTSSEIAGLYGGSGGGSEIKGSLDGNITLGMNGTIDTEGTIRGSAPTVGIASPTFSMRDFDLKNSTVGQGVWNIKNSPVVYWVHANMGDEGWDVKLNPYFFDPSSIEVVLNPNLFPRDKIEWMDVRAVCGSYTDKIWHGTDFYRKVFKLGGISFGTGYYPPTSMYSSSKWTTDFLNGYNDKSGTQWGEYAADDTYTIRGRKWGEFFIEPQAYSSHYNHAGIVPAPEVVVFVILKMTDQKEPIVLSRSYLPNVKTINLRYFDFKPTNPQLLSNVWNQIRNHELDSKQAGHRDFYDYQVLRIYHILKDHVPFRDLSADYYNQFNRERKIKGYIKKLEKLGVEVDQAAWPIATA